ncbi:hypothetical protein AbraCBS73388_005728 [Aspergillus brasiliensis]|uniref:Uncharacterized protein n=1 Tax=Aspergillus brasiliensis TaxID=319629 RepID=A0A9W6DUC8_9EURO|nr:hypothetical protein AbraCBS73388_005728 [Aspergillus brasiliensis]
MTRSPGRLWSLKNRSQWRVKMGDSTPKVIKSVTSFTLLGKWRVRRLHLPIQEGASRTRKVSRTNAAILPDRII